MDADFQDKVIEKLLVRDACNTRDWKGMFLSMFHGQITTLSVKKALLLLAKRGERTEEFWGCVSAVRQIEKKLLSRGAPLIDICGTGGDGLATFNISTVAGFVLAGAGAHVAKHGNRAISSLAGSSDLIERLGIRLETPPRRMLEALQRFGFGYFHAPRYHTVFARLQGVRRELGIRTLFNGVGPLLNPLRPQFQIVGVSNPRWARPLVEVLRQSGVYRGAVVRSLDGLDELSPTAKNDILYLGNGRICPVKLDPRRFGIRRSRIKDLAGGNCEVNREIALGILRNRLQGPREDAVVLNAGYGLWLIGLSPTLAAGIDRARWSLRSGCALTVLERVRDHTQRN